MKKEQETLETAVALAEFDMLDALAFIINKISCEVVVILRFYLFIRVYIKMKK